MDTDVRALKKKLQELRSAFDEMAQNFTDSAAQLKVPGMLPPTSLDQQLGIARESFAEVIASVESLAARSELESLGVQDVSLEGIERFVGAIEDKRVTTLVQAAIAILREVLQLEHCNGRLKSQLDVVRDNASVLMERLRGPHRTETLAIANEVSGLCHPLAALLTLAKRSQTLDEERQTPLADLVSNAYGTHIMLAAVQGHLVLPLEQGSTTVGGCGAGRTDNKDIASLLSQEPPSIVAPQPMQPTIKAPESYEDKSPSVSQVLPIGAERLKSETLPAGGRADQDAQEVAWLSNRAGDLASPPHSIPAGPIDRSSFGGNVEQDVRFEPLPEDLTTFDIFSERYYISVSDRVEPSWWRADSAEFAARIRDVMPREMQSRRFNRIWILSHALEAIQQPPLWSTSDITALAEIAAAPLAAASALDPGRLARLKERESHGNTTDLRLMLFLEAVRPSPGHPLDHDAIDKLVDSAAFQFGDLKEFVRKTLKVHFHGQSTFDLLRGRVKQRQERSKPEIAEDLESERRTFKEEMVHLWSAAGGKIQRTHCREAWDRFIQKIEPVIKCLYPLPHGTTRWDVTEMETHIAAFEAIHRRAANKGDVKYSDRHRADNAARHIMELAMRVNNFMRELQQAELRDVPQIEPLLPELEARRILETVPNTDSLECIFVGILQQSLQDTSNASSQHDAGLELDLRDFLACPGLLGLFEPGALRCDDGSHWSPRGDVRQLRDTQRAAAHLLECQPNNLTGGLDVLVECLRRRRRFDLIELLDPLTGSSDRDAAQRQRREFFGEATDLVSSLHRSWRHLCDMASPAAAPLGAAYRQGTDLCGERLGGQSRVPKLVTEWLTRLNRHGEAQVQITARRLEQRAREIADTERRELALNHIKQRHYADALWVLGESPADAERWRRETMWRASAIETFSSRPPWETLKQHQKKLDYADKLIDHWLNGYQGTQQADRPLRTNFSHMLFRAKQKPQTGDSAVGTNEPEAFRSPVGTNEPETFRVSCKAIIEWLAHQNLNPSFFPQLRSFTDLVVMTPLVRVESPSLVERLRGQVAGEQGNLCVVLAPRLTAQSREELLGEFQDSRLAAAVIDDIDLCRLLNPGGRRINLVVGLLEIILEQQDRRAFTPFERHDGQHVKLEMFVGRSEQAREIALTSQYSRLFSGRKLGKSALLSYVEQKYDGHKLPSGNRLRVVYIGGVSAGEESDFVNRTLEAMRDRLAFVPDVSSETPSPAARLVNAFDQLTHTRADESLLILFDEADLFVERQVDEYDRRREECLSFVIRSRIESRKDTHGLPRIRFLFSGYRVTHTNAGAWAGAWGDVLRLEPLHPEEAATLVRGPLERLGIDSSDVANLIAWRCGYQPSIIISFCRQLLGFNAGNRVTPDDVAHAFDDPKIQDEIRAVIESNFQGNGLARIVFLATVLIFNERHLLEGVADLADLLIERLRSIFGSLEWLQSSDDEKSALSQLASLVNDFVRRQLLHAEISPEGVTKYYPRFPHHLPILAQEFSRDAEGRIRSEIEAYVSGREPRQRSAEPRSLFPRSVLDNLQRAALSPIDEEMPVRAVVLASTWGNAVPIRLILPNAKEVDGSGDLPVSEQEIGQPDTVVRNAPAYFPQVAQGISAGFSSARPSHPAAACPPTPAGSRSLRRASGRNDCRSAARRGKVSSGPLGAREKSCGQAF